MHQSIGVSNIKIKLITIINKDEYSEPNVGIGIGVGITLSREPVSKFLADLHRHITGTR